MRIQVKRDWREQIQHAWKVAEVIRTILMSENEPDRDKEHVWCIGLNGNNSIKYIDLVHLGAADCCIMHPREVFRLAVLKSAVGIIVSHNHPSGDPSPSKQDKLRTEQLVRAGDVLGIKILDHVIVGEHEHFSFLENGIL